MTCNSISDTVASMTYLQLCTNYLTFLTLKVALRIETISLPATYMGPRYLNKIPTGRNNFNPNSREFPTELGMFPSSTGKPREVYRSYWLLFTCEICQKINVI